MIHSVADTTNDRVVHRIPGSVLNTEKMYIVERLIQYAPLKMSMDGMGLSMEMTQKTMSDMTTD